MRGQWRVETPPLKTPARTLLEIGKTKQQPATLVTWGANDRYFVADGARAYLTDVPNAELHLLDTGHFALATHAQEIADLIAAFHAKHTAGDPTTAGASA